MTDNSTADAPAQNIGHISFWMESAPLPVADIIEQPGLYRVSLDLSRPIYAAAQINMVSPASPPLLLHLHRRSEGPADQPPYAYEALFRLAAPCKNITIHMRPACAPKLSIGVPGQQSSAARVEVAPLGLGEKLLQAFRRVQRNFLHPFDLWKKMRHARSGTTPLSPVGQFATDPQQAYHHWRATFEHSDYTRHIAQTLQQYETGQPNRLMAIVQGDSWRETLPCLLTMLEQQNERLCVLIVLKQHDITDPLIERARSLGAQLFIQEDSPPALSQILQQARQCHAQGWFFLQRPGQLHTHALECLLLHLHLAPKSLAIYTDYDILNAQNQRVEPHFLPCWSPDLALGKNYTGPLVCFRTDEFYNDIKQPTSAASSYDLLLYTHQHKPQTIHHIPLILFHANEDDPLAKERQREEAQIATKYASILIDPTAQLISINSPSRQQGRRIHFSASQAPSSCSILIPSKDNPQQLRNLLSQLQSIIHPHHEIVLIDNGSKNPEQRALLQSLHSETHIKLLSDPSPFNFSQLINKARNVAKGDILLMLNDDVKAKDTDWLEPLIAHAKRSPIGCVGAMLLYSDGTIQHGGIAMGVNGICDHMFHHQCPPHDPQNALLYLDHEVSAVTGACLAIKSELFDQLGGMDENLPVTLNDVDLCLRARQAGLRNLMVPSAQLYHGESITRKKYGLARRCDKSEAYFIEKWGIDILQDPYFSPHLSPHFADLPIRP